MRVTGIFTGTTDSLSPLWRQCPDRYAIRAGRNLPDKEFRYLRTVIVTAAVYRGFNSELRRPEGRLTLPLNLPAPGRRQTLYVVFDLAESCVFAKQSPGPFHCDPRQLGGPSLVTAGGTPSPEVTVSICRVPSQGITQAPWDSLPVYVCPFAVRSPRTLLRGFSWQHGINDFAGRGPRDRVSALKEPRIFLRLPPTRFNLHFQS